MKSWCEVRDRLPAARWKNQLPRIDFTILRKIPRMKTQARFGPRRLFEERTGKNMQHSMVALVRQSIFSRLAGYEDTDDAERLSVDPTMWASHTHLGHGQFRERDLKAPRWSWATNQMGNPSLIGRALRLFVKPSGTSTRNGDSRHKEKT
jgi:hypothetical protein